MTPATAYTPGPLGVADVPTADVARTCDRQELLAVAQQFEAMLLTQMLREMRRAGEWNDEGGGADGLGLGLESFEETIDAELGLHLARHRGIGLTSELMEAFERVPTVASANSVPSAGDHLVQAPADLASPGYVVAAGEPGWGAVTSEFGWRKDPFTGTARFHRGVDVRVAYGQDVRVAAPGTVVFSGEQQGYGTTVVVEHADRSRTRYAHLSAASVSAGSVVALGDTVGQAGHSGRATGTHLHFEVTSPDGAPMSPGRWMQQHAEATGG